MAIARMDHVSAGLVYGHGIDLPAQAARVRAMWLAGRHGRAPVLLVALLWARDCPDVVRKLEQYLEGLFADYRCTPQAWSEAQAARQALAALNQQLFRHRQSGRTLPELNAGLLLVQGDDAQFLQAGAIGLLRYQDDSLQSLVGRSDMPLGQQAELALVQHSLPLDGGETLLLAPQPLLDVADVQAFRARCQGACEQGLDAILAPLLSAPGAAVLLAPGALAGAVPAVAPDHWPPLESVEMGQQVDGWTLFAECPFGPPQRLFLARDAQGREALLWAGEQAAGDVFWLREWVLRRSPVPNLPQVLPALRLRRFAYYLFEAPAPGVRSLADWAASQEAMGASRVMALLEQLISAVRALQRRGVQGVWLNPRHVLVSVEGQVVFLPGHATLLPGGVRQPAPAGAIPLAPELRNDLAVDGRADQFALAALAYWLLCGQWPEVARPEGDGACRYVPVANFNKAVPAGWDGVLARALAPQPTVRFDALSEFQQALRQPLQLAQANLIARPHIDAQPWRLVLVSVLLVHLSVGLWLSLGG